MFSPLNVENSTRMYDRKQGIVGEYFIQKILIFLVEKGLLKLIKITSIGFSYYWQ